MRFSLLPVSVLFSLAAAQTTLTFSSDSAVSTACSGQLVLNACVASTKAIVAACATSDWGCLCQKWTDVLTCYTASGCANDPTLPTAQNSRDTYCAQASIYSSSSTSAISNDVPTPTPTGPTPTPTGPESQPTPVDNSDVRASSNPPSFRTATASSASPSQSGSGASLDRAVGAGSLLMGLAGLVAAAL